MRHASTFRSGLFTACFCALSTSMGFAQSNLPFAIEQLPSADLSGITVGDFNGDGIPDFAGLDRSQPQYPLVVHIGLPAGGTIAFTTPVGFTQGQNSMQSADLNHDGDLDIAVAHAVKVPGVVLPPFTVSTLGEQLAVSSLLGDGAGAFPTGLMGTALAPPPTPLISSSGMFFKTYDYGSLLIDSDALQLSDLNGDGNVDATVATYTMAHLYSPCGFGSTCHQYDGGFYVSKFFVDMQAVWTWMTSQEYDPIITTCSSPIFFNCQLYFPDYAALAGTDWDNDGRVDSIFADGQNTRVILNSWSSAIPAPIVQIPYANAGGVTTGDWNLDGRSDAFVSQLDGLRAIIGSSTPSSPSTVDFANPGGSMGLRLADFNRDGLSDLASVRFSPNQFAIRYTTPQFSLGAPISLGLPFPVARTRTVDVNADGQLDIVAHLGWSTNPVLLLKSALPQIASTVSFGFGTPSCFGQHGVQALSSPTLGNSSFAIGCTNVPSEALGLCISSDVSDLAGTDSLGVSLAFHVGFAGATYLNGLNVYSDAAGSAQVADPIPNDPALLGNNFYYQFYWVWLGTCQPSPFFLSSSKGLQITMQ
ncbi:MAG: VCBS repeat-containing protein [Planctomycetes bacterium]|nr:VCBS repeat-containing protein [Planctomycetota bacterium]